MGNGHGGERAGAGAPRGGVSQLRRIISGAIADGLVLAGEAAGIEGNPEEVARQTAARIVSDMILAGRGEEVLKLGIASAVKAGGEGDGDKDSLVLRSLRSLPGIVEDQKTPRNGATIEGTADNSTDCAARATDCKSAEAAEGAESAHQVRAVRPYFEPQIPLLPAVLEAPTAGSAARGGAAGAAPHPPAPVTPAGLYPPACPLENFGGGAPA